jgi:hypothetical protein
MNLYVAKTKETAMKHARFVQLILLLCATSSAFSQNRDAAIISKFVVGQADSLGGQEYARARKIISGNLNHDGIPDAAVLYTIEGTGGGNNYTQYLAVFVRDPATHRLVPVAHKAVGGKLYREISLESIADNVIVARTKEYTKHDASCCPSKKGTASFVLDGSAIKEQKTP